MKIYITVFFQVISFISMVICGLWTLIEFLLYLVTPRPFDWMSLQALCYHLSAP